MIDENETMSPFWTPHNSAQVKYVLKEYPTVKVTNSILASAKVCGVLNESVRRIIVTSSILTNQQIELLNQYAVLCVHMGWCDFTNCEKVADDLYSRMKGIWK
jgi:hypothetical protein